MKNIFIKQYFSIIFGMLMLFSLVPMHAMQQEEPTVKQQEVTSQSYWTRFKNFLHRTPLFPGWRSTEEQKAAAERTLALLLVEREKLEDERKSQRLVDERLQEINKELKRISDEINEQKVILGKRWSSGRRLAAGIGVVGLAGLGAKYVMSVPSLPDPFNAVVKDEEFRWEVMGFGTEERTYLKGDNAKNITRELVGSNKLKSYFLEILKDKDTDEWEDSGLSIMYSKGKWKMFDRRDQSKGMRSFDIF